MGKAIFTQNRISQYDDQEGVAYHFPKQYLTRVESCLNDWVILYQSSKDKSATQGYYAAQKIVSIKEDEYTPDHYYAVFGKENEGILDFPHIVPIKDAQGNYFEGESPSWQSAVRRIDEKIFYYILAEAGYEFGSASTNSLRRMTFHEPPVAFLAKDRDKILATRAFRDAGFRKLVLSHYNERCAMTGQRLVSRKGLFEVEAAHIRPVEHLGPDKIQNALCLSKTIHWLFDNGMICIGDNYRIYIDKEPLVRDYLNALGVVNLQKLHLPENELARPHKSFLAWHRGHWNFQTPLD